MRHGAEEVRFRAICGTVRVGDLLFGGDILDRDVDCSNPSEAVLDRPPLLAPDALLARRGGCLTAELDVLHGRARGDDAGADVAREWSERGHHLLDGPTEMHFDGHAIDLGKPSVDAEIAEVGIEHTETDGCELIEGVHFTHCVRDRFPKPVRRVGRLQGKR